MKAVVPFGPGWDDKEPTDMMQLELESADLSPSDTRAVLRLVREDGSTVGVELTKGDIQNLSGDFQRLLRAILR